VASSANQSGRSWHAAETGVAGCSVAAVAAPRLVDHPT